MKKDVNGTEHRNGWSHFGLRVAESGIVYQAFASNISITRTITIAKGMRPNASAQDVPGTPGLHADARCLRGSLGTA